MKTTRVAPWRSGRIRPEHIPQLPSGSVQLRVWVEAEAARLDLSDRAVFARVARGDYPGLRLWKKNRRIIFVIPRGQPMPPVPAASPVRKPSRPEAHHCDCGAVAVKCKSGDYVCAACDRLEENRYHDYIRDEGLPRYQYVRDNGRVNFNRSDTRPPQMWREFYEELENRATGFGAIDWLNGQLHRLAPNLFPA